MSSSCAIEVVADKVHVRSVAAGIRSRVYPMTSTFCYRFGLDEGVWTPPRLIQMTGEKVTIKRFQTSKNILTNLRYH